MPRTALGFDGVYPGACRVLSRFRFRAMFRARAGAALAASTSTLTATIATPPSFPPLARRAPLRVCSSARRRGRRRRTAPRTRRGARVRPHRGGGVASAVARSAPGRAAAGMASPRAPGRGSGAAPGVGVGVGVGIGVRARVRVRVRARVRVMEVARHLLLCPRAQPRPPPLELCGRVVGGRRVGLERRRGTLEDHLPAVSRGRVSK